MNRLLSLTLAALILTGTLGMTTANATNREVTHEAAASGMVAAQGGGSTARTYLRDGMGLRGSGLHGPSRTGRAALHDPGNGLDNTGRWRGFCSGWWLGENLTPAIWNANPDRGRRMMLRLAACLWSRLHITVSFVTLMGVLERESSWYIWAVNPDVAGVCQAYGSNPFGSCGLGQHLARYWPGRVSAFLPRWAWGRNAWPPGPFDPRANLWITAKMMQAQGGACPAWC